MGSDDPLAQNLAVFGGMVAIVLVLCAAPWLPVGSGDCPVGDLGALVALFLVSVVLVPLADHR